MVHYAECSGCRRARIAGLFRRDVRGGKLRRLRQLPLARARPSTARSRRRSSSPASIASASRPGSAWGSTTSIEVLTGADTEKIRRWGHEQLSTYGIGKEHSRPEWAAIGRELVRLGYLRQTRGEVQRAGADARGPGARSRSARRSPSPNRSAPRNRRRIASGEIACDEALFERLRQLRKRLADERGVPPYIVFSDVSLRQMARDYPGQRARVRPHQRRGREETAGVRGRVPGGDRRALASQPAPDLRRGFLCRPRARFPAGRGWGDRPGDAAPVSRRGIRRADRRAAHADTGTIYGHLAEAVAGGRADRLEPVLHAGQQREVAAAFKRIGPGSLSPCSSRWAGATTTAGCGSFARP